MNSIRRDVSQNIDSILYSYESIAEYIQSVWGLGPTTADDIEDWYWRTRS